MIKACELKRGVVVDIGGAPHVTENIVVQTPSARGGATLYKVRFRNIQTRQKVDQAFKGDDALKEAAFETRPIQYLYRTGDTLSFMDLEDYSQFDLNAAELEDELAYLVEDLEGIAALVSDGRILGIRLPDVVEMPIAECDPPLKGSSVTNRNKPAIMPTGLTVQVPEYIEAGECIRIDTRTGAYLSRA